MSLKIPLKMFLLQRAGKNSNLTVTINKQTAGQYWCRASVDGYQDIEAPAMVYVKGKDEKLEEDSTRTVRCWRKK